MIDITVKNRIKRIAEVLREFNKKNVPGEGNYATIKKVDVSKIVGFSNYPTDFQCFISEVGYLDLATCDYAALCVDKPSLVSDLLSNMHLQDYDLRLTKYLSWGSGPEDLDGIPEEVAKNPSQFVIVAAWPCSYEAMGFDLSVHPYRPFNYYGDFFPEYGETFLDFVEYEIKNNPSLPDL